MTDTERSALEDVRDGLRKWTLNDDNNAVEIVLGALDRITALVGESAITKADARPTATVVYFNLEPLKPLAPLT
jgi:hypothetical protein